MPIKSGVTGVYYPTCTDKCADCGNYLGTCLDEGECNNREGRCLDDVSEVDGKFYHGECTPADDLIPDDRGIRDYH